MNEISIEFKEAWHERMLIKILKGGSGKPQTNVKSSDLGEQKSIVQKSR